ncbi:MAG: hypothetical protein LH610_06050 [Sphingomonas bacterium]|nr:hypothetical protein [Sphingomonas bacterium]
MAKNGRLPNPFALSGIYYVRRRVPKDLRPFFNGEFVMRSLTTRDPVEAAQKFPAANALVDAQFASMRQSHGTWPSAPHDQQRQFDAMIDSYLAGISEVERRTLNVGFILTAPAASDFDDQFDGWTAADRSRYARELADDAAIELKRAPLPVPIRDALYRHIETGLRKYVRIVHRPIFDTMPAARKFTPDEPKLDLEITLSGLKLLWVKTRKPAPSSVEEMDLTIRDFTNVYGNIPAADVTRTDIEDYKRRLGNLPRRMSKRERALPFMEREQLPGVKLTAATVGKKITLLKGLMAFGHNEAKLLPRNAGSGIATGAKHTGAKRDQFTPDEVTRIFDLPLFQDPSSWVFSRSVGGRFIKLARSAVGRQQRHRERRLWAPG